MKPGIRRRPLAPRGPTRCNSAHSSSDPRCWRSSTWNAVSASTPSWPAHSRSLAPRIWCANSKGVEKRFAWPAMWATSWAYVPRGAVGGPGPVLGLECVDGVGDALVLRLRQPHHGRPFDHGLNNAGTWPGGGGDDHELLLVAGICRPGRRGGVARRFYVGGSGGRLTPSAQMSIARSSRTDHRVPPGSLASCWLIMPTTIASQMSLSAWSVRPKLRKSCCPSSHTRTEGA